MNDTNNTYYSPLRNLKDRSPGFSKVISSVSKNRGKIFEYIAVGILISVLVIIGYYILFPSKGYCTSDTVDTIMWAQATLDSSSGLFNSDFYYACLAPFGGYIFMLPYVAIFGYTLTAQVLGMFTFFLFFSFALFNMVRKLNCNLRWCAVIVSLLMLSVSLSRKLREIFWEHIIHYSLEMAYAFVGLTFVFLAVDALKSKDNNKKFAIYTICLFVWCVLAATNRVEALIIFLLPMLAAVVAERLINKERAKDAYTYYGNILLVVAIVIGIIAGYMLGNVLTSNVESGYEQSYSTFSAMSNWADNLKRFYLNWITLLGVDILGGQDMVSMISIADLLRLCVSIIVFIAPIIWIFNYKKIANRNMRIFLLFHWFMTACIMLAYITGVISSYSWRICPIIVTSVLLTGFGIKEMWKESWYRRFALIISIPISIVCSISAIDMMSLPADVGQSVGYYRVAEELKNFKNNYGIELSYGYATYWNSNVITLINQELPVRYIELSDDSYYRRRYQTNETWYSDQPGVDTYFVLVSESEFETMQENKNELLHGDSIRDMPLIFRIYEGRYYVLVYGENIF